MPNAVKDLTNDIQAKLCRIHISTKLSTECNSKKGMIMLPVAIYNTPVELNTTPRT